MNKRTRLFLLLISLLLGSTSYVGSIYPVYAEPNAILLSETEWIQIENVSQGYKIGSPKNATVKRFDPDGILHIRLPGNEQSLIIRTYKNLEHLPTKEWVDRFVLNEELRGSSLLVPLIPFVDRESNLIENRTAESFITRNPAGEQYRTVVVASEDNAYIINYPLVEEFNTMLFKEIVSTFRVVDFDKDAIDSGFVSIKIDNTASITALDVPYFSQKDNQWICDQIGTCNCDFNVCTSQSFSTIGDIGCLLTSQSMLFEYYAKPNHYKNPLELDTCLTNVNGYGIAEGTCTNGYCATWYNTPSDCRLSTVTYLGATTNLDALDSDLENGHPAIILVDGGAHFVVATGKSGGNYQINDPFFDRTQVTPGEIMNVLRYSGPVPDSIAPITSHSLSGTTGDNDWYISNATVNLTATDSGGSGIQQIDYKIDDGSWQTSNSASASFTVSENGTHTVYYKALDRAGNWESEKSVTFKIDAAAPTLPASANPACTASHNVWQNSCNDASFTWDAASDSPSGVAGYEYYWGTDSSGGTGTWTTNTSYDPAAIPETSYFLRLRAKDNAGNWSSWKTLFTLRYDATAPTGAFLINNGSTVSYLRDVRIQNTASDNLSGLAEIRIRNEKDVWHDWQEVQDVLNWFLDADDKETYTIEAQFRDKAGNESDVISQHIYLDLYPARPSSSSFYLSKSTFGAAGWNHQSSSYQLLGTFAQTSPADTMNSNSFQLTSGYWAEPFNFSAPQNTVFLPLVIH